MIAPLLGEPFGYESQQYAAVFNNIIAFHHQRHLLNASASAENDFGWHTEDAFCAFPPDYVWLCGYRNTEKAPTGISSVKGTDFTEPYYKVLAEPGRFQNKPNPGHVGAAPATGQSLLSGDRAAPYLRVNVPNVTFREGDAEAAAALELLKAALARNRQAVVIGQGELLVIDNGLAVHSRDRFNAIYGPGARWLSRLVLTRDLRKSRMHRASPEARVMLNVA
jgi:hypothetical protein